MANNGLHLITPTSIAYSGGGSETATIDGNGSVLFSNCSSVSLNGVFSADYDNYIVVKSGNVTSGDINTTFRYRSSGVDDTGSFNYSWQRIAASGSTIEAVRYPEQSVIGIGFWSTNLTNGDTVTVYGPYLPQSTSLRSLGVSSYDSSSLWDYAGTHSPSSSYDGFTYINAVSQFSGRIAVYGMVK